MVTGTDLEVRDQSRQLTTLTNEQLQYIAGTEFVPPGLRGNLPAILACVATGRALGIADMSALRSIHIIDGKATFSAELMVQLVRRAGHSVTGEVDASSAKVTGTRADNGDTMTCTWTLDMAERAGLLGKSNWKRYPESMLWARAASQLCRMLFADCFAGATYTPEELEDSAGEPRADQGASTTAASPSVPAASPERPSPAEAPITAAQKKKANLLVGNLRDELRLTTEEVYAAAGRDPEPFRWDDGSLHWSPLRDSLTKKEASDLIDMLEAYAVSDAKAPPWTSASTNPLGTEHGSPVGVLVEELLQLAPPEKRDMVEAAIRKNKEAHTMSPLAHKQWLEQQIVKAKEKAAEVAEW